MTRAHRKELKKVFDTCKPQTVLEIGVGQGRLFSKIENIPGVGIDLSINMLKCFKKKSASNVELVQADANHLPFRDECFDLVYTCTVLIHIPDTLIELAVSEIKRVARNNIFIIEQLPNFQHINTSYSNGGYCFPHEYQELFKMQTRYCKQLKHYGHEVFLLTKNS
jgi:ubiquinone/menaquinone biosynthesis C-methylase UbiE